MRPSALASPGGCEMWIEPSRARSSFQPHAFQHGRVLLQRRQVLVVDDRRRHVPGRVDRDELHGLRQQRRRMDAGLAGHYPGGPDLSAVLHHLERIVGDVEDDIGVADRGRAEVARQPAPALHVDEHRVDLPVAFRVVDGLDGPFVQHAGGLEIDAFLEFAHGLGDLGVVMGVAGIFGDAELGAQLRHARIFHRDRGLLLAAGREFQRRAIGDLDRRPVALAAQFGELRLQFAVELLRRVVAVERRRGVLGGGDVSQHFGGIDRMFRILDIARDLRPVHPAALRLARIIHHARGQLQVGFRQRVGAVGRREIRHRIVGCVQGRRSRRPSAGR